MSRCTQDQLNAALRVRSKRGVATGKISEAGSEAWVELWKHWSTDFERRHLAA
jgi:hypothetical protein